MIEFHLFEKCLKILVQENFKNFKKAENLQFKLFLV